MKAIILARVSTEEQESNPAQVMRLKEFAKNKGFTDPKIYEIEESSSNVYRKKFQEILDEIKKSNEKVVLFVDTIDRLQRSFRESVIFDDLRKAGKIEIYFYRENLHLHQDSNSSELTRWDMGVMFARSYVLQLGDNVKRSFEKKRRDGEWLGRAPFGYLNVADEDGVRKDIIPDPVHTSIVEEIFNRYVTGDYSVRKITDDLNNRGIKTINNKKFYPSSVHQILSNPFYYGDAHSRKYGIYPHKYKPIISKTLWLNAQEVRKDKNNNPTKTTNSKEFIFSRLLKCADCGCSMTAELHKDRYVYYSCTNAKRICKRVYTREEEFMKSINDVLSSLKLSDEQVQQIVGFLKDHHIHKAKYHKDQMRRLRGQYDAIQGKTDRLLDLLIDKQITQEVYDKKSKELRDKQHNIEIELEEYTNADESYHLTAKTVLSLAQRAQEIFNSSETSEKRQLLKYLLQNPTVKDKKLVFKLQTPFDTIASVSGCPIVLRSLDDVRTSVMI